MSGKGRDTNFPDACAVFCSLGCYISVLPAGGSLTQRAPYLAGLARSENWAHFGVLMSLSPVFIAMHNVIMDQVFFKIGVILFNG